jgi:anti-sigma factor RsiW
MKRPITEDDLQAYVDNVLESERRAEVDLYLSDNPEALKRITSFKMQADALRAALAPVAKEAIPNRLNLEHIVAARRSDRLSSWRMAAAAVVLVVAGGTGGWAMRGFTVPPSEGVAALAQEASASYATFATGSTRPVELTADHPAELASFASSTLGRNAIIPDLSKAGYRLMGGRAISTPHGPGFMIMYDNDQGSRLVMLSRKMVVDQNKAMAPHAESGLNGWTWAKNGMGFSVVGASGADELHPLADDVRSQVSENRSL